MKKLTLSLLVAGLLGAGHVLAQEVRYYDKAPSVEELQRQLLGEPTPEGQRKVRTRAIVFGDAPPAQPAQPAPAVQPVPVAPPAASYQAPAVQQPAPAYQQAAIAPAAQTAQPATMQVSEKAIAFPINFRVNSAEVLPESIPFLESIAGLLQSDPSIRLLIEGHTDISGNYARNMTLSRERAFAVMNFLIDRYRIDPTRLVPVGKGPSEPLTGLAPTDPKNRRVQFRILG